MSERPKKWWKSSPAPDPRGEWTLLITTEVPLSATWQHVGSHLDRFRECREKWCGNDPADPVLLEQLNACPACEKWDPYTVTEPIAVPLAPTERNRAVISRKAYEKLLIFLPFSSPATVVHHRILERIAEDFDDHILLGEVYVHGGDRIPDLVSVIDRAPFHRRARYRKVLFKYPHLHEFKPCPHCGRLYGFNGDRPDYILSEEVINRSPRFDKGMALLPPETFEKISKSGKVTFSRLMVRRLREYREPADPMPVPYPAAWDELDQWFSSRGMTFPFPRIAFDHHVHLGPWIMDRIDRLGEAACVSHGSTREHETKIFYLRMRALFEPKVAARIDGLTNAQLGRYLSEYTAATGNLVGYFPI